MGLVETLIGKVLDVIGELLRFRPSVRVHPGTSYTFLVGSVGGPFHWSRNGTIRVFNAGRSRITINGMGWIATDGHEIPAAGGRVLPASLDPGDPELVRDESSTALLEAHEQHGGLTKTYVELAGESKARTFRLPKGWLQELRDVHAKPDTTY